MKKINMKIYQNITTLIVYLLAIPLVAITLLAKLLMGALSFVHSLLMFRKQYRTEYEWKFIGKYGKFLQSIVEEM